MEQYTFLIVGIILLVIGIINMTGNISMIHSYNRKKVKEEDAPKYGKAVGIGTVIVGAGAIIKFVLDMLKIANIGWYTFTPMVFIGLAFILYAQFKYNKGIF